jgi:DNA-binding protein Fis
MQAKRLLEELCDPKMTPRIPAGIRDRARGALRHYPSEWDKQNASNLAPIVFQEKMEPLYRMVKQYEQEKKDV